jgi:hypothetical protein
MDRSKVVAIVTGAIAVFLSVLYLIVVQFLDFRGEMLPAPISQSGLTTTIAQLSIFTQSYKATEPLPIHSSTHPPFYSQS